jgi:phage terminase large subunit
LTLQRTTAQRKISKLRKRVRIVQGGTSSSKTFSIIPLLIDYAIAKPKSEISIVSESIPHLRRGALKDFIKIMDWTHIFREEQFNRSTLRYDFTNGSYIEFFSADQSDKLRGARRDVLFVNECNNITFESYHQLAIRTRRFIYLDYNPTSEFWVHKELLSDKDAEMIILTYKDNEALDSELVKEIEKARDRAKESTYWANWWKVYGLGQIGVIDGVIFSNWQIVKQVPDDAELLGYGLDFGFTNDPSALISVHKFNSELYIKELIYQTRLTNNDIVQRMIELGVDKYKDIIADSAEPKSIEDIYRGGFRNIYGAKKGADSIRNSIDKLQRYKINITESSTNLIKEFRGYVWTKDKNGNQTGEPIGINDHGIAALRYFALNKLDQTRITFL